MSGYKHARHCFPRSPGWQGASWQRCKTPSPTVQSSHDGRVSVSTPRAAAKSHLSVGWEASLSRLAFPHYRLRSTYGPDPSPSRSWPHPSGGGWVSDDRRYLILFKVLSTGRPGRPPSSGRPGRPPSTAWPGRPLIHRVAVYSWMRVFPAWG